MKTVSKGEIDRILSFLPYFEERPKNAYKVGGGDEIRPGLFQMPFASYTSTVDDFIQALYESEFVQPFDWTEWQDEAEKYVQDPGLLDDAGLETIIKLFTTHVRKERFCDGHLGTMILNGHILRLLQRLEKLAKQAA